MKATPLFALAAILLFAMSSCATKKEQHVAAGTTTMDNETPLTGTYWKLVEVAGKPVSGDLNREPHIKLQEEDTLVVASGGCNSMSGSYELGTHGKIRFSQLISTMMACENMEVDRLLSDALETADSYLINGDTLLLHRARMASLAKFVAVPEDAGAALNGTWELNYISGPRIAFDGLFPNRKPTLTIDLPESNVSGNGGCNSYRTSMSIDGHNIKFGLIAATKMFCEGVGESTYFETLGKIDRFSVSDDGKTLNLIMGDIALMRFEKK